MFARVVENSQQPTQKQKKQLDQDERGKRRRGGRRAGRQRRSRAESGPPVSPAAAARSVHTYDCFTKYMFFSVRVITCFLTCTTNTKIWFTCKNLIRKFWKTVLQNFVIVPSQSIREIPTKLKVHQMFIKIHENELCC